MITHSKLLETLSYNKDTGIFTWVRPAFNKTQYIGKQAGSIGKENYLFIKIDSKRYSASRLAWFYVTGQWPEGVIDHIDHNVQNNAIDNLRDITIAENCQNQIKHHKDSSTKYLGIRKDIGKRTYNARIQTNGKRISLGHFYTKEDAYNAYINAKRCLHNSCTI